MENKPNFKKCKDCGAYGLENDRCKYFRKDLYLEVICTYFDVHPNSKKKKDKR